MQVANIEQEVPRRRRQAGQFPGQFQASGLLHTPLRLRRNEMLYITVNFTGDFLNDESIPVQTRFDCEGCIFLRTKAFQSGCDGDSSNCLSSFASWTRVLMESPPELVNQCNIAGSDELYIDLYTDCLCKLFILFETFKKNKPLV